MDLVELEMQEFSRSERSGCQEEDENEREGQNIETGSHCRENDGWLNRIVVAYK